MYGINGDPFYTLVKETLAAALAAALGERVAPGWMDCVAQGCHVRTAAPLRLGIDAGEAAAILQKEGCGMLFGFPLVRRVEHNAGHLLFTLTPVFFTRAMELTFDIIPPALDWYGVPGRAAYACVRMQMLSRRLWADCPDDPAVQLALWRALGIPERLMEREPLRLRVNAAADALLTMTHALPPRERPALLAQCGGVGEASARLLSLGLQELQ